VFHHQEGVAQVPEFLQGVQQAVVVPLVEADGRLIEDVEHPHQPRPDLGGQPDPLALPARERRGLPVEREILQADLAHKAQPGADLLEDLLGDLRLAVVQPSLHPLEVVAGVADRHPVDRRNRGIVDKDGAGLGFQPRPLTGRTGGDGHELLDVLAGSVAVGLDVAPLQVVDDALEALGLLAGAVFCPPLEVDAAVGPVQKLPPDFGVELLERRLE